MNSEPKTIKVTEEVKAFIDWVLTEVNNLVAKKKLLKTMEDPSTPTTLTDLYDMLFEEMSEMDISLEDLDIYTDDLEEANLMLGNIIYFGYFNPLRIFENDEIQTLSQEYMTRSFFDKMFEEIN